MLPEKFSQRMKRLLGKEYEAFEESLDKPAVRALRVNTLKISPSDFLKETTLDLEKLPFEECGFIIKSPSGAIGNSPAHMAGEFYMQDAGAMATVAAIPDIKEGMWVADLCAAPGGKSTQLAAKVGKDGFILSNEYVPKRAKILVGNFERMGIGHAVVTSQDTGTLSDMFRAVFDIVVADAPCSGEGMFRKDNPAREEWSEEGVLLCQARQEEILANASKMVRDGGLLVYSTCTYSVEENEAVVDNFLASHSDFSLVSVRPEVQAVSEDGIFYEGCKTESIKFCRRFYPHKFSGEGQFIAILKRENTAEKPIFVYKEAVKLPNKEQSAIINKFFSDNLKSTPQGRVIMNGESAVLIPHACPIPQYSVFSAGVLIGEIRGKLLFPAHHFFSVLGKDFIRQVNLSEEEAISYLRGEELSLHTSEVGFASVLYNGATLGGGKLSSGKLKNHYPKGLRLRG